MENNEGFIKVTGGKIYWRSIGLGPKTPTQIYASQMTQAKIEVIEDASHLAIIERPEEYMRVISEFLDEIK